MYADQISHAMQVTIDETARRRKLQQEYNDAHGITPESVRKSVRAVIEITEKVEEGVDELNGKSLLEFTKKELKDYALKLEKEMKEAAKDLQFERAALLRDRMLEVRAKL
ncbi:MAG: UvrB/UvrC motif-containing protein [Firmicutes bacterium]|nr:UvrB/UvrC motif-containing protein [Bacillota bacterium]